jgi:hypothetical protein
VTWSVVMSTGAEDGQGWVNGDINCSSPPYATSMTISDVYIENTQTGFVCYATLLDNGGLCGASPQTVQCSSGSCQDLAVGGYFECGVSSARVPVCSGYWISHGVYTLTYPGTPTWTTPPHANCTFSGNTSTCTVDTDLQQVGR